MNVRRLQAHAVSVPVSLRLVIELLASLAFAILFFVWWPTRLIADDGGIVLRYMDNFAKGYFYTYNPSDGPVFGVSSFTHGILAGFFAYTHLLSPLNSLFASNFIGLVLTAFLVLRLLSYYLAAARVIPFVWLAVLLTIRQVPFRDRAFPSCSMPLTAFCPPLLAVSSCDR